MIKFQDELKDLYRLVLNKPGKGNGDFAKRIRYRHDKFWESPDAEIVRNTIMSSNDPIEQWKNAENWQRRLSNKYNAKEFAKLHGVKVADLYWKGRNLDEINFKDLPQHFVIRPTIGHGCNLVYLFSNSINLLDNQKYSTDNILSTMKAALDDNPNLEFIIEELLKSEQGEYTILNDYKFYMFNGTIGAIQVVDRITYGKSISCFYDENWNEIERIFNYKPLRETSHPAPKCLEEMIESVKVLSKAYEIFARIDLYATDKGAVFGEFTPTPYKGSYFTRQADKTFTKLWDKYCTDRI